MDKEFKKEQRSETTKSPINSVVGRMRKNHLAARASTFEAHLFDVVLRTATLTFQI